MYVRLCVRLSTEVLSLYLFYIKEQRTARLLYAKHLDFIKKNTEFRFVSMRLTHSFHKLCRCRRIIANDHSSRNHAVPPNWLAKLIDTKIARSRRWDKFFFLRATDGCTHFVRCTLTHVRSKVSVSFFLPSLSRWIQHFKYRTVGLRLWPETRAYVLSSAHPRAYWLRACLVVTLHYLVAPQRLYAKENAGERRFL